MLDNLAEYSVVLGSNSPRRKELLGDLGIDFEVKKFSGEENYPSDMPAEKVAQYLARLKADSFTNFDKNELYITADTVVIFEGQVLGKPESKSQAKEVLRMLSGGINAVVTGVCIQSKSKRVSFSDTTQVSFAHLSEEQIAYYVNHFNPMDKAGAYGIQEWIGLTGIVKIQGSYPNVVGLPTQMVYAHLRQF